MYIIIAFIIVFIVILIFTLTARDRMLRIYQKYSKVANSKKVDGKNLAFYFREKLGMNELSFARTSQKLADAYYIKERTLLLSNEVADTPSLASLTIVAHEFGHALQHKTDQNKFHVNYILQKITRTTNKLILPIFLLGLIFYVPNWLPTAGLICLYGAFVLFLLHLAIKLSHIPVEYDASRRGLQLLQEYDILSPHELKIAKKLLKVAAGTYIASFFDGILIFTDTISYLTKK